MRDQIFAGLGGIHDELVDVYRELHRRPELSGQEHRSAQLLARQLRAAGIDDVTEQVGSTGVVGVLRSGDGPVVMLRADFDALPVEERTGLPYASTERALDADGSEVPVMHACGHDMHAACLLGAARLLAGARDRWRGTVLLVFQPAEELGCGARNMVNDGLFVRFPVPQVILGQHVGPLPAGFIGHGSGPVMTALDTAAVTLYGRGGHGSRPEATVDPVLLAAHVVTRLQGIVAREVPPSGMAVVTVGGLQAGTKDNIIPDRAESGISVRSATADTRAVVLAAVERVVRGEAEASGAPREPEIVWTGSVPALISDPAATATTLAAFVEHFGAERVMPMPPVTASEDVGIFGESLGVPTVFWFWGGLDTQTTLAALRAGSIDQLPGNHSPYFAPVIEPTLSTGVTALTVAALTWLDKA